MRIRWWKTKRRAKAPEERLEAEHCEVAVAHTGEDGFYLISTQAFDLVLLDLMLPGRSGLILRAMRTRGLRTPVLILTKTACRALTAARTTT